MICPVCSQETTIHHETDGICFLLCGHTARHNPGATHWSGLLDGKQINLNLKGRELVPASDMKSDIKWTTGQCPVCFSPPDQVHIEHKPDGAHILLKCGHIVVSNGTSLTEDTFDVEAPKPEMHTTENMPERGQPTDVAPNVCAVCGRPGGDYRVTFLPRGFMTCGHNFKKNPNGTVEAI